MPYNKLEAMFSQSASDLKLYENFFLYLQIFTKI